MASKQDQIGPMVESGMHLVPPHMHHAVRDYFYNGYQPGGFLTALLSNDLMGAIGRADEANLASLPDWGRFLYNHAPSGSYGSSANVDRWLATFDAEQVPA